MERSLVLKRGEIRMIKKLLAEGLSKSAIARKLGISRETVRRYAKLPDDYVPHVQLLLGNHTSKVFKKNHYLL